MSRRILQVNQLLKKEIAEILQKILPEDFGMVTITDVETSADLKNAKVWVSILQDSQEKEILSFLENKSFEIQKTLSPRLKFKFIPQLFFKIDKSTQNIFKIEQILKEIHKNK